MNNLFAYGTLLDGDIFRLVTDCRCRTAQGIIKDYRRLRVRGEDYPGLTPAEGFQAAGLVYCDLPASAWDYLDRFEGDMYERRPVRIELADGGRCSAAAYVVRPEFADFLELKEWKLEDFISTGKTRFQKMYLGFDILGQ